jgi:ABC transporter C-terminal domain
LEVFEGGFPQAALFMEALALEKEVNKMSSNKKSSASQPALSFNEKKRHDVIQSEIEAKEKIVNDLKAQMESSDYTKLAPVTKKLKQEEAELEKLINEWTELEEKMNPT